MIRFSTYLFICLTLQPLAAQADSSVININMVSDINYPPYSYIKDGKSAGIYTEIVTHIGKQLPDYNINISPMPWKRALYTVKRNRSPIVIGAYKRPIKRPYLGYSEPILLESVSIFCHKRVLTRPRNSFPEDFRNLRVGIHNGFLMGNEISKAEENGTIILEKYLGAIPIFRHILNNQLDCYVNDQLSILFELKNLPETLQVSENTVTEILKIRNDHTYLGTSLNTALYPNLAGFILSFNREIKRMHKDGSIQKIINNYTD